MQVFNSFTLTLSLLLVCWNSLCTFFYVSLPFWYYSQGCIANEAFLNHLLFCSKLFCDHFGVCLSILESYFLSFLMKSVQIFFLLSRKSLHCTKKNIAVPIILLGILCSMWAYFGYIPKCLEKIKTPPDFLHKCLGYHCSGN